MPAYLLIFEPQKWCPFTFANKSCRYNVPVPLYFWFVITNNMNMAVVQTFKMQATQASIC